MFIIIRGYYKMNKKIWSVYIHTNKINNKKYIGITSEKNPERRWGAKGAGYLKKKNGKYCQPAFANAILKYGWENFSHEIIKRDLTQDQANSIEAKLINDYKTQQPKYGYNIQEGGCNGKCSKETKEKMKKSHTGHKHSEETKKKISCGNTGKKLSEETKEKLSFSHSPIKKVENKKTPNNTYNQQYCKCIETGECYASISNAAINSGTYNSNICKCIKGERKLAGGYHWEKITKKEYEEYLANNK